MVGVAISGIEAKGPQRQIEIAADCPIGGTASHPRQKLKTVPTQAYSSRVNNTVFAFRSAESPVHSVSRRVECRLLQPSDYMHWREAAFLPFLVSRFRRFFDRLQECSRIYILPVINAHIAFIYGLENNLLIIIAADSDGFEPIQLPITNRVLEGGRIVHGYDYVVARDRQRGMRKRQLV